MLLNLLADANNVDLGAPVIETVTPTSTASAVDKVVNTATKVSDVAIRPEWQLWLVNNWGWILLVLAFLVVGYLFVRSRK